jgi:hypothetical protein
MHMSFNEQEHLYISIDELYDLKASSFIVLRYWQKEVGSLWKLIK